MHYGTVKNISAMVVGLIPTWGERIIVIQTIRKENFRQSTRSDSKGKNIRNEVT